MDLYTRRQLRKIRGVGPRRVSEIEAALVLAGLNLAGHHKRPRAGRTATRPGAPSAAHPRRTRARKNRNRDRPAAPARTARPGAGPAILPGPPAQGRPAASRRPGPGRGPHRAALRPRLDPRDPVGMGRGRTGRRRRARRQRAGDQFPERLRRPGPGRHQAGPHPRPGRAGHPRPRQPPRRPPGRAARRRRRKRARPADCRAAQRPVRLVPAQRRGARQGHLGGPRAGRSRCPRRTRARPRSRMRPAPALPARRRPVPAPAKGARAPRPVDPAILARVKSALERL